jgi:MFS family permease
LRSAGHQLDLVRRAAGFRLLFLATLFSGLGTWLAVVALTVDVWDRTHSAKWVSALLIADFLPAVAIGLALGPLIDRLSRRRLMIVGDLARVAVFCALPFTDTPGGIVILAAAAGFATGFFRPAVFAGLPNLVPAEDLPAANSLLRTAEYLMTTAGTLLGGVIVAAAGPHPAYWANAVSFLISAFLIARIPAKRLQAAVATSRGHWRDLAEGFGLVRRSQALLTVFIVWNLIMFHNGAVNVAEVKLAKVSFEAGDFGFGLMWAFSGLGLVFGSLLAVVWLERYGIARVYTASIAAMALGSALAAISPSVWVAIWCVALGGGGNGAANVYNLLLVQRGAPDRLRGRAFTVLMSSTFALMGIGMIVAGPLTDRFGARWLYAGAAAIALVATVVASVMTRGMPREPAQEREPEPEPVPDEELVTLVRRATGTP